MSISLYSEDVAFPKIKKRNTGAWLRSVIEAEGKKVGDISFIFCSDEYLLDINRKYLDHDYFTDIITFDYVEGLTISGDIFISVDRVSENCVTYKCSFEEELNRILAHGVLHLLGYKDKSEADKKVMTGKEDYCLKKLNEKFLS